MTAAWFVVCAALVLLAVVILIVPPADGADRRSHLAGQVALAGALLLVAAVIAGLDTGWLR